MIYFFRAISQTVPRQKTGWLLALLIALQPLLLRAEVYRCIDPAGHPAYQSEPCPGGQPTGISDQALPSPSPVISPPAPAVEPFRPPAKRRERSSVAKTQFKKTHPCPTTGQRGGSCPGYVIDHIRPLAYGGADEPENMQWQTEREAKVRDGWERDGCGLGGLDRQAAGQRSEVPGQVYIGPRGGRFVITPSGNKRYLPRE